MGIGSDRYKPRSPLACDYSCLLLAIVFSCSWIAWGGHRVGGREVSAIAIFAGGAWVIGLAFHRLVGTFRLIRRTFPLVYVTGVALLSVGMFLLKIVLGLSLSVSVLLLPAIGLIVLMTSKQYPREATLVGWEASIPLGVTILSLLSATLWSSHLFPESVAVTGGIRSRMFIEYYAHGVNVLPLLGAGTPSWFGSPHFIGEPWSFYHLASHLYPAYLSEWTGQPLVAFLGSSWHPFGYSLLGLGAYVLSSTIVSHRHGLWSVLFVALLPDPTFWSWELICYSFGRNVECTPAASLGCALGAIAVAMVIRGAIARSTRVTLAGFWLATLVFFIRANFLFCILPSCGLALLLARNDWPKPWTIRMVTGLLLLGLFGGWLGSELKSAPTLEFGWRGGEPFAIWSAGVLVDRTPWTDLVPELGQVSIPESILRRTVFLLLGGFQAGFYFVVALGLFSLLRGKTRGGLLIAPVILLGLFVVVGLFMMPNQNGDPFEIPHRPFVWYYYILAIWAASLTGQFMRGMGLSSFRISLLASLLAVVPAYMIGSTLFVPFEPKEHFIPEGLVDASRFIREHSDQHDRFVDSECDPLLISGALAERPEFVCWGEGYNFPGSGAARNVRAERSKDVRQLLSLSSEPELVDWFSARRVRWILVHPQKHLGWPASIAQRPVFQSKGFRVFDLSMLLESTR
ncbi:hypothetical protein K2X85_14810 [bacterium]|nr:hypothetical protein [bacterium]